MCPQSQLLLKYNRIHDQKRETSREIIKLCLDTFMPWLYSIVFHSGNCMYVAIAYLLSI